MPVLLNLDLSNALPNMVQLMMNSQVTIKLAGSISAGRSIVSIRVPVNFEGKQDIKAFLGESLVNPLK